MINSIAYSMDGRYVASGSNDCTIRIYSTNENECNALVVKESKGTYSCITSVLFSPDGRLLIASALDGFIRIWDHKACSLIECIKGHSDFIHDISIAPDGNSILSAGSDGTLTRWDISKTCNRSSRELSSS